MNRQAIVKILSVLLLPAMLLTGCGGGLSAGSGSSPFSSQEQTDTESPALPSGFALPYLSGATLDPVTCPDGIQQTVASLLYEGLYELNRKAEPEPRLCSVSNYDAASFTWSFTLRSGVTFSDGSPLTAEDAAASLRRACASGRYGSRLAVIKSVGTAGGAVLVSLNRADTGLPALLDIPIVKSGTEDTSVPVGTGPYCFVSDGSGKYLSANAAWWGGNTQPVNRIGLVACEEEDAARYQFTSHAVQLLVCDLTGTQPLSATGSFEFSDADTTILQYLGFNLRRPLFADSALRRALSLGIDRNAISRAYLSGHAAAAQFPVNPVSSLYPAKLEDEYSLSSYTAALQAALPAGGSRELTLIVNSENSFKVSAAKFIASSLSASGLRITVNALVWSDYLAALSSGNFDLFYGEVRLSADWDCRALLGTGGALNYGGYTNATMDLLINQYAASVDRAAAMESLCRYFKQEAPILPICFKRTSVLTQKDVVQGLSPTAANPFFKLGSCTVHLAK
ncbi:MAG: ABC transporter substrate-binding protein [Oscillibacter sp.]|jgi:peptide/nickel transport system substrate-binding protein|nr:ABC transporter substrate-binding protein [Oscillibacter sp.]